MPRGKEADTAVLRNGRRQSVRGEFVKLFREHPDLLGNRNNDAITEIWLKQHPDEPEMPRNVRNTLANVKSQLRKKERKAKAPSVNGNGRPHFRPLDLEALEVRIDEALTLARALEDQGLESVTRLLRRARNEVVWKLGQ